MNGTATRRAPAPAPADWVFPRPDGTPPTPAAATRRASLRGVALSGSWVQAAYLAVDVCFVAANGALAFSLRFSLGFSLWPPLRSSVDFVGQQLHVSYIGLFAAYAVLVVLCCQSQNLYRTPRERSATAESFAVAKAVLLATVVLIVLLFTAGEKHVSRLVLGMSTALNLVTLIAWRLEKRRLIARRVGRGLGVRHVLIVGAGRVGHALARVFDENRQLGCMVQGFLDHNHAGDARLLGRIEDLPRVARTHFVDEIYVTIPSDRQMVKQLALDAWALRIDLKVVPDLYDGLGWRAPLNFVGEFPVLQIHAEPNGGFGLVAKRLMDIAGSALALLICAPLLGVIAAVIKADSPGPVLYRSMRVGRKGRKFTCYKFRTMTADADAQKDALRARNERDGPFFKISCDPRVTCAGHWLRRYSLDELPQFWNVLRGDMSLVGPRPPVPEEIRRYDWEYLRRLDVKPGISGLWQVTARRHSSFAKMLALDLEYIESWSLRLDLKILIKTVREVIRGSGS